MLRPKFDVRRPSLQAIKLGFLKFMSHLQFMTLKKKNLLLSPLIYPLCIFFCIKHFCQIIAKKKDSKCLLDHFLTAHLKFFTHTSKKEFSKSVYFYIIFLLQTL